MEINIIENLAINWEHIPSDRSIGRSGYVISKTVEIQSIRIRKLRFSENYEANQWCEKGHIIFVLKGELIIEYQDNSQIRIQENSAMAIGDNISSHKAKTEKEAIILIVD